MKKWLIALGIALALLAPLALSQRLQVTEYEISSDKIDGEATLVLVSDLHNARYGENQAQLAEAIRAAGPDAVLFAGDMADSLDELEGTRLLAEALGGETPVFYVSGNHESASGELEEIKAELRGMGIRVLEGESELLPCGVRIAGADDPLSLYRQEWRDQIAACRGGDDVFTVLLSHRPDRLEHYAEGFDLTLCGHAHGGQVRIPLLLENGLWSPNQGFFPEYTQGVHEIGEGRMVVSRGMSRGFPPRIFNRPELVILRLRGV